MTWTTPADLRAQVQKLWDKGDLLRPCVQGAVMLPRRLRLIGPTSAELTERFDEVRVWMKDLGCNAPPHSAPRYRIVMREFRHRVLGVNAVPDEVWLDTLDHALALIGKQKDARRFASLVQLTREQHPVLLPWLEKRPLNALALADAWQRLLNVVSWLQSHPHPGIYLRQVDLAGVDSKFIEANRGVLSELLDLALPLDAIDASATGANQFCRRYGFKDKPLRIRFRLLDARVALLPNGCEQDISLTQAAFEQLDLPLRRVFMTENEINFLAFPAVPGSLVIFGAGYGFEAFAGVAWLHQCDLYYWGDIDTHGFAILDQLRAQFSHVQSLLMDHATLMAHQTQWGQEPQPLLRDLPRLTPDETALFNDLRDNKLRVGVRLEQERIGFGWVQRALADLKA
ncbi:Wadjet anti-phage system protein JetD domain-containing protein [Rhodoferax ferrireducens]|uniref:Wadjet anti-phage system protein JetD domain-containing protein n=1 Tax=Rhodoferax ferrireducens TaxID=192843 RepID=UPI003BB73202